MDRYKYYGENLAGRQVMMNSVDSVTSVSCLTEGEWRNVPVRSISKGNYELILPEQIGVSRNDTVSLRLFYRKKLLQEKALPVPKMRHWTVMIFPHSHVDVGYTHTQDVVEFIHRQNIDMAIELAERTKDYPEDARFRWNTEVTWPMERYLAKASPEKRDRVLDAIRKGYVSVDNSYSNTNTTATHEPELVELFSSAHRINELTGVDTHTMIQVDIPGFTWGIPALASLTGVRNIISLPNGGARVGRARDLDFSPRYWIGPDGKSKVLFIQPGPYCDATLDKREPWFFDNLGMRDTLALPRVITTDNPRRMFIDGTVDTYLPMLEAREGYFYDIFPMSWCLSDNVPLDGDLPDAVKSWNEEYAYPHLKICTSSDIVRAYEKYSDRIPVVSGDYTEYWTDGLGTAAYQTG
ncbi:MAG: glycosyl hydrolase, partial [Bacteroidales bacterium]|nr:glycosyl hydrolase [Bacteroidales bacterium]